MKCPLVKRFYVADDAQTNYTTILSKSREGANITEDELAAMDGLIYRLTGNGQSMHAVVILTDNGAEFSNPLAIEFDHEGNRIANLFYCDPGASYQKPHVERNHEGVRLILPKNNRKPLPRYPIVSAPDQRAVFTPLGIYFVHQPKFSSSAYRYTARQSPR